MAKDFKATQTVTSKLIGSGGLGINLGTNGSNLGLMAYSGSQSTNQTGGFQSQMLASVGTDVWFFISGSESLRPGDGSHHRSNTVLFGGDVVISGTLHAERQIIEVDQVADGDFYVSGNVYIKPDTNSTAFVNFRNASDVTFFTADASNQRIGIGVTDPDSKLEVLATTVQQKWSFDSDSSATMTVADSSNTTFATAEAGTMTLDAGGAISIDSNVGDIYLKSAGVNQIHVDMDTTAGQVDIQLKVDSDDLVFKQYDGTEIMRIMDSGPTVFGAASDPGAWSMAPTVSDGVHVQDKNVIIASNTNNANSVALAFNKSRGADGTATVVQSGDTVGEIKFLAADGSNFEPVASIKASVDSTPGNNDTPGRLTFLTTPDGSAALSERMRIDNAGKIGIGTTLPLNKVQIDHSGADGDDGLLIIRADSSTADTNLLGGIGFDSTDGNVPSSITEASAFIAAYAAEDHATTDKGGDLVFGTTLINDDDDTVSHERMRILDSGNVGIGVSDPDSILEVYGTTTQQKWSYDASTAATISVDTNSHTTLATLESGQIILDAAGDIILDAGGGDIEFASAGTPQLNLDMAGTNGEIIMQLKVDADDFVFKQYDGTEVFRVEDNGDFDIGGGLGSSGVTVSSSGAISADGRIITDDATDATSTTDGSIQTDGGLSVAKDAVIGDDLILLSDSSVIHFGAGKDVTLTHTNDVGIHINSGMRLGFRDQGGEYIYSVSDNVLGIVAANEIDLTATDIDINGDTDISGNLVIGGNLDVNGTTTTIDTVNMSVKDSIIALGVSGSDGGYSLTGDRGILFTRGEDYAAVDALWFDGTRFNFGQSKTGPLSGSFATVDSYSKVRISRLEITNSDNRIALDTDLTIRSAADIVLNPAGGDVNIIDAKRAKFGTAANYLYGLDSGLYITGSNITATSAGTMDLMSANILLAATNDITLDAGGADILLADGAAEFGKISNSSSDLVLSASVTGKDIIFKGQPTGGSSVEVGRFDMSDGIFKLASLSGVGFTPSITTSNQDTSDGSFTSNVFSLKHTLTTHLSLAGGSSSPPITVTNNKVLATSVVVGCASHEVDVKVHTIGAGSFKFTYTNITNSAISDNTDIIFNFVVFK
tara:strand:- start:392 stop:3724 length:3333 start_codon:yes stop_codon:yes gene_type:complete